jgi:hypothetical protein
VSRRSAIYVGLSLIALGLVVGQMAMAAWTTGSPPLAAIFAERAEVKVLEAEIVSGRQNGAMRHLPHVLVEWNGTPTELPDLKGSFYGYREEDAERAIAGFTPGDTATVRVVNGMPYTNRTNWFGLSANTVLALIAAIKLTLGTAILLLARRR